IAPSLPYLDPACESATSPESRSAVATSTACIHSPPDLSESQAGNEAYPQPADRRSEIESFPEKESAARQLLRGSNKWSFHNDKESRDSLRLILHQPLCPNSFSQAMFPFRSLETAQPGNREQSRAHGRISADRSLRVSERYLNTSQP